MSSTPDRTLAAGRLLLVAACLIPLLGCFADDRPRVSIDFALWADELADQEVLIDGEVVGTLQRHGQSTRMAFPVDPGTHDVAIRHPDLPCQPTRVEARLRGEKIRLMADIEEIWTDNRVRPNIVLR